MKKTFSRFTVMIITLATLMICFSSSVFASDAMKYWEFLYCASEDRLDYIQDVAYGNGTYVAVGGENKIVYSTNGDTWKSNMYINFLEAVCYGEGKFVAVGYATNATATDGMNWDFKSEHWYNLKDVAYGNGVFVAVGDYGNKGVSQTSPDGLNWTSYQGDYNNIIPSFERVEFINGQFIACCSYSNGIYLSSNGETWTYTSINSGAFDGIKGIAYGNNHYMAYGGGVIWISTDLTNWTNKGHIHENTPVYDIVFVNGVFVVAASGFYDGKYHYLYYSQNGDEWHEGANGSGADFTMELSVANGKIFGTGAYETILSTTKGLLPPVAPVMQSAEYKTDHVELLWQDTSDNENQFRIFRSDGMLLKYKHIATVNSGQVSYSDDNVEAGKTYTYMVQAYNYYGESAYSNVLSVSPKYIIDMPKNQIQITLRLPTPENLRAAAESMTAITLTWDDKATTETGYEIERKTENGSYSVVNIRGVDAETYTDTGLQPGTKYTYKIKAYNSTMESLYSYEASATTEEPLLIQIPILTDDSIDISKVEEEKETTYTTIIKLGIGNPVYTVNDKGMTMDATPQIIEGRTMLPIRYVAEALGATVLWDNEDKKTTITLGSKKVELWIGNNQGSVDGVITAIDADNLEIVPTIVPPGRTLLPLRFIIESLGCKVEWLDKTKEVVIYQE